MRSKQYDILLVDDDPEDRQILGEAFAELGRYNRVMMYDSAIAFHCDLLTLRDLWPLPRLVVLDYHLPGADGAMVLSLIKNDPVLSTIPVLMYSSELSPCQRADCLQKGAGECFEKGATYEAVRDFCRQLCEEAYAASVQLK